MEIFNYYVRRNIPDRALNFENLQEGLKRLNMKGYVSFAKDMGVPVDMPRLTEVFRKSSKDNRSLVFDEFRNSLQKLSGASQKHQTETLKRKLV